MIDQSVCCWLRLGAIPRLSQQVVARFIKYFATGSMQVHDTDLAELGFSSLQIQAWHKFDLSIIDRCLQWAQRPNCYIVTPDSTSYPYLLKQIHDPPKYLFVEGDPNVLGLAQIAIVGSRRASFNGLGLAHQFAKELAEHNLLITSGLALGIDGKAHRGALDGQGKTIAVFGAGVDVIYPRVHQQLAEEIKQQGALLSEFYPWTSPQAANFPKRNRIISGLSAGVFVIEAALKSGSLITARMALEQGRDVFALPNSVTNLYGQGSNGLIKQGAFLVESVQDILEQVTTLGKCAIKHQMTESCDLPLQQELPFSSLLANVGDEATSIDMLASVCQQPVNEVMTQLLELELQGLVAAVPGGYIRTRRS